MPLRRKKEPTRLEKAINEVFDDLNTYTSDADEYSKMADQLTKLYPLKETDRSWLQRTSPDTVLTVAANLTGIAVIVGYERANIITSKAIQFILRAK